MILRVAFFLLLCSAIPASATTAYMITEPVSGVDQFGTIDLSTGAFTSVGNTYLNGNSSDPVTLEGLGEVGNTLYGGDVSGNLYSIDTSTGALTLIGTGTTNFVDFGSTLTTLYALNSVGDLYSVSATDGSVALVGSTTVGSGGTSSLSTGSSTLYLNLFNSAFNLYTLNLGSGSATLVGATNRIGALMWDAGSSTLYAGTDVPDTVQVETLNTSNGNITAGAGLTGTTSDFGGLAPLTTTPEPATWSFLAMGLALMAGLKQRGRRRG